MKYIKSYNENNLEKIISFIENNIFINSKYHIVKSDNYIELRDSDMNDYHGSNMILSTIINEKDPSILYIINILKDEIKKAISELKIRYTLRFWFIEDYSKIEKLIDDFVTKNQDLLQANQLGLL